MTGLVLFLFVSGMKAFWLETIHYFNALEAGGALSSFPLFFCLEKLSTMITILEKSKV